MPTDSLPTNNDLQNHQHWMERCIELALQAQEQYEVPVGALVVLNIAGTDTIIGEGWNQPISHCDPSAHAEIVALRQAAIFLNNYRLTDARLYVSVEPCAMCTGALIHARIAQLIFGAYEPRAGAIASSLNLLDNHYGNHKIDWIGGIQQQRCQQMMQQFFRQRR